MKIEIKVEMIHEKGSGEINEDNVLVKDDIFGVFDGATSLDKFVDSDKKTGGFIASAIAKEVFKKNNCSLVELVEESNSKIREEMINRGRDISNKINLWSTSVAVVRIEEDSFEWAQLGDSLILLIFSDNSFKLLASDYDHDKESLVMWKQLADKREEDIRGKLNEQLIKVRKSMNVDYGIINGEVEMKNFLNTGRESLNKVKNIVIFTDGLILPKENPLEKDNFDLFVKLFNKSGLKGVKEYVRNIEKLDEKCWEYPRFKKHDDIGAIAISIL